MRLSSFRDRLSKGDVGGIDVTQEPDSLITEEMRRAIGVESEPGVIEVEKETIRRVADALDDPNPLWRAEEYAKGTSYGGIIAFPIAFRRAAPQRRRCSGRRTTPLVC